MTPSWWRCPQVTTSAWEQAAGWDAALQPGGCGTSHRVTAGAEEPGTHTHTHSYTRKATVTLHPLPEENKRREDRQRKRGQNPTLTSPAGLSAKRLRQGPAPDRCPDRHTAGEEASIIPSGPYGCPQCHQGRGWVQQGKLCAEPTMAHRTPRDPKFSAGSVDRCNGAAAAPLVHSLKPSCPQASPTHVCCYRMARRGRDPWKGGWMQGAFPQALLNRAGTSQQHPPATISPHAAMVPLPVMSP